MRRQYDVRKIAERRLEVGAFFLVNVERSEGTKAPLVNGAPLGHGSLRLEHQDVIEIAGVKMEYLKE